MAVYRSDIDQYLWWIFDGFGDANFPWARLFSGQSTANDFVIINTPPTMFRTGAALVDLFDNSTSVLPKNQDHVVFGQSGDHVMALRNVEYVSTYASNLVDFYQLDHFGFTTDGSIRVIEADIGNHLVTFETAVRDSSLILGDGFDRVIVADDPDVGIVTYWTIRREFDNSVKAFALSTGNVVEIEGGGASRWATNPGINYGEVERLTYSEYRTGAEVDLYLGKGDIGSSYNRAGFENIDLSTYDMSSSPDTFLHASFGSINFSSRNVFTGAAVIEEWNGTEETAEQQSAAYRFSTTSILAADHNHDLLVAQQADEIDGHLRLYVRDETSRTYNRFNEVYLGTNANDVNANTGSTTSRNGTAEQIIHTALYGFDGNDTLQAGAGNDYLFGGSSTYSTIVITNNLGNQLTGGVGSDYFGVGNVVSGATGDAIMTTSFAGRLSGSAPSSSSDTGKISRLDTSDSPDLVTRVGTDRITDWTADVDYLRVLANGTAIIEGLGSANGAGGAYVVDTIGNEAERIDISGGRVNNEGKIVARGLGGIDTLIGSSGDDWLYGNASTNFYFLSEGGNDRVYVDQFDGSRSRHFVEGFTTSGGAASNSDLVMLNKKIIDAFYLGGAGRTAWKLNVDANYVQGQAKSEGVNYLYNNFYSGSYASNNATHNNADGGGFWEGGGGADGTSSLIGLGMAIAGRGMFAIPFVGPIIGAAMIGASIPIEGLGFDPSPTREHRNATYDGVVNAYLNVIADSYGGNGVRLNTTVVVNNSGLRFLDFFQNADVGDGYLPVVEFTAHSGSGIYGYFALHSDYETFVYLVASSDNMVENAEAIFVAEINGRLSASDFGIYNGEEDVYNYGIVPTVVIRTPTVTNVRDSATPTADTALDDGVLADVTNPIVISGSVSGALATGSYFRVYDGPTKIYDGDSPVAVPQVTHSLIGTNFTFTDSRALGTTVENTTNTGTNDTFVLSDAYVRYTVELVDGETGIPTRASVRDIKVSGGNAIIDGGGGADILLVTETSTFLNNISDIRLIGMETIVLAGAVTIVGGVQTPTPINLNLTNQSEGFEVISGDAGDTIVGSSGNDTIFGVGGADSIDAGSGADVVVYSTSFQVVTTSGGGTETNTTTDTILSTASQNLAADLTVDGGNGVDTLRFDTDRYDGSTLMFSAPVAISDSDFAKVIRFENLVLNGTGTQAVTLAANANTAFANGITVTTAATATSLNFDASNANWTRTAHVTGTNNADTITGGAANDTLIGGSGNDTITAGTGNDNLSGGDDADSFVLASNLTSADTISGGDAGTNTDTLTFTDANGAADDLNNVTGIETITLGNTTANVVVTTVDTLVASGATLTVNGSSLTTGTMTWNGAAETNGKFSITGGGAADTIIGGAGNDTIDGGVGADSITAGAGDDSLLGGAGNDTFVLGVHLTSADTISGEGHSDTLTFTDANGAADDLNNVTAIETIILGNTTTDVVVTTVNAMLIAGTSLTVDGTALTTGTLTWNGSAETDATFSITGGDAADTIIGGSVNDTILGGTGDDVITGRDGLDSLDGGAGNDVFIVNGTADISAGEVYNGGGDLDTLSVTATTDFTGVASITLIETISLAAGVGATFDAADLSGQTLSIDGSGNNGGESLTFNGTSAGEVINLGGLTVDVDDIAGAVINAGDGNDSVTGTNGADTITGGAGNDSLLGGTGNDVFIVNGTADISAGEVYNGGDGVDTISVTATTDFTGVASITLIETISLAAGVGATFDAADLSGQTLAINGTGNNGGESLTFNGTSAGEVINLGGLTVDVDDISGAVINAGDGNDAVTGTNGADTITGGAGNDSLSGGNGNDVFIVNGTADISAGEIYDGGNDFDTLSLTATTDFTGVASITLIETISLAAGVSATFDAADISGQTLAIDGSGNNGGESLTFNGTSGSELINLGGLTVDVDDITGAVINAGDGNDTITGTNGVDTIFGGAGNDTFVFAANDTATTGSSVSDMDVIKDFNSGDQLDLTSFSISSGPTATLASGSDGDDYIVSWTSSGTTNFIYLENTGIAGGLTLTNSTGIFAITAASTGAPAFDVFVVGSTGLTVSGDSPYRAYFHDADYTPVKNDTVDGVDVYTGSNNLGASAEYTFATAVIGDGSSVVTGEISLVNTNSGLVNTNSTILSVGTNNADFIVGGPSSNAIYGFSGNDTIIADAKYVGFDFAAIDGNGGANWFGTSSNFLLKSDYAALSNDEFISFAYELMEQTAGIDAFVVRYTDNTQTIIDSIAGKADVTGLYDRSLSSSSPSTTGQQVFVSDSQLSTAESILGVSNLFVRTGSGADYLIGGAGNDTISGGGGADIFVFSSSATNGSDTITDFSQAADKFDFSNVGPGTFTRNPDWYIVSNETANTDASGKVTVLISALADSSDEFNTASEIAAQFASGASLGLNAGASAIVIAGEDVTSGSFPSIYIWHIQNDSTAAVVDTEVTLLATVNGFGVTTLNASNFIL